MTLEKEQQSKTENELKNIKEQERLNKGGFSNSYLKICSEINDTLFVMIENKISKMKFEIIIDLSKYEEQEILKKYKFIFPNAINLNFKKKVFSKKVCNIEILNTGIVEVYCNALNEALKEKLREEVYEEERKAKAKNRKDNLDILN